MSVRIHFDQSNTRCYTNLDFVTGRVILVLPQDATISAINVKLEAESRTRLAGPKSPHNDRSEKKRTELEVHKLLYKVMTVFPGPELQPSSANAAYTLLAGQYEYPFHFKIPFNNDCSKNTSVMKDLKVGQLSLQFAPDTNKHVLRGLPPSLSGFPGEAEIKYFVKATVVRPKFFQENIRTTADLTFLPIETPRPPRTHEETFARRKQQFQKTGVPSEKNGLSRKASYPAPAAEEAPLFQVDARLPNPPILTCNQPIPLRVLVQKLNGSPASVFLSMFQIELIGYTKVRAHDLNRVESGSWVLLSQANMNMPIDNPADRSQREWKLPSRLWENLPLPSTVSPSFTTCNIARYYELEIRVGLAHAMASGVRPELIVLPLRLQVKVWSGIAPTPEVLKARVSYYPRKPSDPIPAPLFSDAPNGRPPTESSSQSITPPPQDFDPTPPQIGAYDDSFLNDLPDDAPPSYEDAITEDIGPVDGPRRQYSIPADPQQQPAFNSDEKGGGLSRRVSERLFSQNAPSGPFRRRTSGFSDSQPTSVQEESPSTNTVQQQWDVEPRPPLPTRPVGDKK